MLDLRPVGHVIGLLVAALGASMLLPLAVDLAAGNGHWPAFAESALVTTVFGVFLAISCANGVASHLTLRQTFLMTTSVWLALPIFGALPFLFGETDARYVDAFFEAMSGLTTTGSTVFGGTSEMRLEDLPEGLLLWRGLLQWFGGIGIIVVAMAFLPELRVGGMQIFRSEGFDTFGKILPRATEIATRISVVYISLTLACGITYFALGMSGFDATVHAMTTIATGGFANFDASFAAFGPGVEYAAVVFMALAALPFVRYVQMLAGGWSAPLDDPQIRGFLITLLIAAAVMVSWQVAHSDRAWEPAIRKALFNVTSIVTGTGYASEDYMLWGSFAVTVFFFLGLIGGCAGSTSCSVKIFRYQLLFASISAQIRAIHSPRGMFPPRYDGRPVGDDVLDSVMAFFVVFIVTLGLLSIALGLTGLDFVTSVSGAGAALGNIGPGLGPEIGPASNFAGLNDAAKWLLAFAMLLGRLELLVVFALLSLRFWRE